MDITGVVDELRRKYSLNRTEFAIMIGVVPSTITRVYQNGIASNATLAKIKETFNLRDQWWLHDYIYPLETLIEPEEKEEEKIMTVEEFKESININNDREKVEVYMNDIVLLVIHEEHDEPEITLRFKTTWDTAESLREYEYLLKGVQAGVLPKDIMKYIEEGKKHYETNSGEADK